MREKGYEREFFIGKNDTICVCQIGKEEKDKLGVERPFQSEKTTCVKDGSRKSTHTQYCFHSALDTTGGLIGSEKSMKILEHSIK